MEYRLYDDFSVDFIEEIRAFRGKLADKYMLLKFYIEAEGESDEVKQQINLKRESLIDAYNALLNVEYCCCEQPFRVPSEKTSASVGQAEAKNYNPAGLDVK